MSRITWLLLAIFALFPIALDLSILAAYSFNLVSLGPDSSVPSVWDLTMISSNVYVLFVTPIAFSLTFGYILIKDAIRTRSLRSMLGVFTFFGIEIALYWILAFVFFAVYLNSMILSTIMSYSVPELFAIVVFLAGSSISFVFSNFHVDEI